MALLFRDCSESIGMMSDFNETGESDPLDLGDMASKFNQTTLRSE